MDINICMTCNLTRKVLAMWIAVTASSIFKLTQFTWEVKMPKCLAMAAALHGQLPGWSLPTADTEAHDRGRCGYMQPASLAHFASAEGISATCTTKSSADEDGCHPSITKDGAR